MNELIRIILEALLEETDLGERRDSQQKALEYAQVAAEAIVAHGWPRKDVIEPDLPMSVERMS